MQVTLKSKRLSRTIKIDENENILFAGLRQGLKLPYSCASGTCGTCQAKIVGGNFIDAWPAAVGKKFLPEDGKRLLMCQTFCKTDSELGIFGAFGDFPANVFVPKYYDATLTKVHRLTKDVMVFNATMSGDFRYRSGQFAMVQIPGVKGWRAYSMSSMSKEAVSTEFLIKRVFAGEVSNWLFEGSNIGNPIRIFGPLGSSILKPEEGDQNIYCICGGSGIAGIMAIIEDAWANGHLGDNNMEVFFGLRSEKEDFLLDRLSTFIEKANGALKVTVSYSEQDALTEVQDRFPYIRFEIGFVHEVAFRMIPHSAYVDSTWFLAGPPKLVDITEEYLLSTRNVCSSKIRLDRFG